MILQNVEIAFIYNLASALTVSVSKLEYLQKPIYENQVYEDVNFKLLNNLDQNDFRRGFLLSYITEDNDMTEGFFRQWLTAADKYIYVDNMLVPVVIENLPELIAQWGNINYVSEITSLELWAVQPGLFEVSFNLELNQVITSSPYSLEITAKFPIENSTNSKTFKIYYSNDSGVTWTDTTQIAVFDLTGASPQLATKSITLTGSLTGTQYIKLVNNLDSDEVYYSAPFTY